MSKDQLRFHRAWKSLEGILQELMWVHYVPYVKMKQKFDVMHLTEEGYFKAIDKAQARIERAVVTGDL